MTVIELIDKLSRHNPNMHVYFPTIAEDDGTFVQYECVDVEEENGVVVLID